VSKLLPAVSIVIGEPVPSIVYHSVLPNWSKNPSGQFWSWISGSAAAATFEAFRRVPTCSAIAPSGVSLIGAGPRVRPLFETEVLCASYDDVAQCSSSIGNESPLEKSSVPCGARACSVAWRTTAASHTPSQRGS